VCTLADALDAPKQVQRGPQLLRLGGGERYGVRRRRPCRLAVAAVFPGRALRARRAHHTRLRLAVRRPQRRRRPGETDAVASRRPTSGRYVCLRALRCHASGRVRPGDAGGDSGDVGRVDRGGTHATFEFEILIYQRRCG